MIVSEDSAIAASKKAYTEMLKPYAEKGEIDNNPVLKNRVYKITGRLIARPLKFVRRQKTGIGASRSSMIPRQSTHGPWRAGKWRFIRGW